MDKRYAIIKLSAHTPHGTRNKLTKLLLGTTVTINGRRYRGRGLVEKYNGIRLCRGAYLVPLASLSEFLEELEKRGLRDHVVVKGTCLCSCT